MRYKAFDQWWFHVGLGCLFGVPALVMTVFGQLMLLTVSAVGVGVGLVSFVGALAMAFVWVMLARRQFIVDDDGLTLVNTFRTHRIPWEDVAVIEQSRAFWPAGAVVVVLRYPPGKRILAYATMDRYFFFRGEDPFDWTHTLETPRPPTRAAVDAHRRWLAAAHR